jgi:hypothetical protein
MAFLFDLDGKTPKKPLRLRDDGGRARSGLG